MKKQIGDCTLRELFRFCKAREECAGCELVGVCRDDNTFILEDSHDLTTEIEIPEVEE